MKVAAVVPTCRGWSIPDQSIPVDWIIVHDRERREIEENDHNAQHIVAPDPDIYGERTSAIRQAGLDAAYDAGYDYVLTLDDDCLVPPTWAQAHVSALRGLVPRCHSTVPGQVIRGIPTGDSIPVGISHGLWSGVLDYPAWYQLAANPGPVEIADNGWRKIGTPFPMCGMNVGFRREVLPAVFFQHTFRRHDDIFAGWVAQRILDLHGFGFVSGGAVVRHERASNAERNLELERPGDEVNASILARLRAFTAYTPYIADTFYQCARFLIWENKQNKQYQEMVQSMLRWSQRRNG
jgi:hypothetical protein